MTRSPGRWRQGRGRPAAGAAGALLLALLLVPPLGACVSSGTYEEVVGERDRLQAELELARRRVAEAEQRALRAEATEESLSAERMKLIEEIEEKRQAEQELAGRVRKLGTERSRLASELKAREAEIAHLRRTYDSLVEDLESEVESGRIEVQQLREGVRLNLPNELLFESGSARLRSGGRAVLAKVADRLDALDEHLRVEGHTDNVPIRPAGSGGFQSNWELAGARAARVVELLVEEGIDPERMAAVSYGSTRPVAPNDTPEGRARNRRIEIRLIPPAEPEATPERRTGPTASDAG